MVDLNHGKYIVRRLFRKAFPVLQHNPFPLLSRKFFRSAVRAPDNGAYFPIIKGSRCLYNRNDKAGIVPLRLSFAPRMAPERGIPRFFSGSAPCSPEKPHFYSPHRAP
jgi:hypothetical protein